MIKVKLIDGCMKEIEEGSNGYSLAASISKKLAKEAIAAKINGKLVDLNHGLKNDDKVEVMILILMFPIIVQILMVLKIIAAIRILNPLPLILKQVPLVLQLQQ